MLATNSTAPDPALTSPARWFPGLAWLGAWPTRCLVCRRWDTTALCRSCHDTFSARPLRCPRCALALPKTAGARLCGACLTQPPPWDQACCAEDYVFPWDRLIIDFKFHRRIDLAGPLSRRLTDSLRGLEAVRGVDLVLPVPLSNRRLRERGFNQAWEIARRTARALGLQARADVLSRTTDTLPQAGLSRSARAHNVRQALAVHPTRARFVSGRHVAVVDDIMTTGATLAAAAAALRAAGATAVSVWALARTP